MKKKLVNDSVPIDMPLEECCSYSPEDLYKIFDDLKERISLFIPIMKENLAL